MSGRQSLDSGAGAFVIAILCALASGAGFYFSIYHGAIWPLAWVAPIPILWLAFGPTPRRIVFLSAWAAYAIGSCNVLPAYADELPVPVLILMIAGPSAYFALSVSGARFVAARVGLLAGAALFGALWTSFDFLVAFSHDGTAPSPAYSQVGAPILIQSASVFGIWVITFLLGFVPAGVAASLRSHEILPAAIAVAVLLVDAGFGYWRLAQARSGETVRVGLAADDSVSVGETANDFKLARAASLRYAAAAAQLARQGAKLIVFPEKIIRYLPATPPDVDANFLNAAHATGATIVAGLDVRGSRETRNTAFIYEPDNSQARFYYKRHMVTGLEDVFVPGTGPFALPGSFGVEVCKDMDYPGMLQSDVMDTHSTLLLVPAWDFGGDRWWHARLAIMRGVEDGVAVARAAKDGLLTLSDAQGRVLAMKASDERGMVTLVGNLPRGTGKTIYLFIGDLFAWMAMAASATLLQLAFVRGDKASPKG
jgi:apolipoprotein N-acyltransferase